MNASTNISSEKFPESSLGASNLYGIMWLNHTIDKFELSFLLTSCLKCIPISLHPCKQEAP